ncbi:MAG: molybdopterin biosynthesis protein MoeB, partial [Acidimicrobiia bacterium]|nr:molybdopterin biosynthesis protein MoeB [Acidimicrobiia bacterium]
MATFRDLLSQTKSQITEIEPSEAEALRGAPATVFLDVREPDEFEQGAIPDAIFIPRGHLEAQVESRIPDRDSKIVVFCAGGVRSA